MTCGAVLLTLQACELKGGKFVIAGISSMTLRSLDLEALKATPLTRQPFEYFVVPGFVRPEARAKINADYPKSPRAAAFLSGNCRMGPRSANSSPTWRATISVTPSRKVRSRSRGPADHDDGSRSVQPEGWANPHRHEKQDHHGPHLHEPRLGKFWRSLAAPEISRQSHTRSWKCRRPRERCSRSSDPTIPGTGTSPSLANAGSSSSTGSLPKAIGGWRCCATMFGAAEAPVRRHASQRGLIGPSEKPGPRDAHNTPAAAKFSRSLGRRRRIRIDEYRRLFLFVGFFSDRSFSRLRIFAGQILRIGDHRRIQTGRRIGGPWRWLPSGVSACSVFAPIVGGMGKPIWPRETRGGKRSRLRLEFFRSRPLRS